MSRSLILFDFDGTITTSDTFVRFMLFANEPIFCFFVFAKHSIRIVGAKIGLIDAGKVKEQIVKELLKGRKIGDLMQLGNSFISNLERKGIIKSSFLDCIRKHKANGAVVCLVSASLDLWLRPFCDKYEILCICTEVEFINGKCTGCFVTPNCNYEEKSNRIREEFKLSEYEYVIAYGNSKGDEAMFGLAHEVHRVN